MRRRGHNRRGDVWGPDGARAHHTWARTLRCAARALGAGALTLTLALALEVACASDAFAQEQPERRSEELDFEGDVVETSFLKPDASLVEGEARKGGASLLKIRRDFIPEIVRSAEDL